jgi:hypothetical protein
MSIKVYNVNDEEYFDENTYLIHRPYILANPYTHIKDKQTKALFVVPTREEAIEKYSHYFDVMYSGNKQFKAVVDDIYEKYKNGEEIKLGCFCYPQKCHGDIIAKKMQARLIKEKISEIKSKKDLE